MGDENPNLVEYNLMSVGLNGMSDRVQELTNFLKNHQNAKRTSYPNNHNQAALG